MEVDVIARLIATQIRKGNQMPFTINAAGIAKIKAAAIAKVGKYEQYIPQEKPPLGTSDYDISNRQRQKKYRDKHKREWRLKP
ncbi:hypothetical protein LPB67_06095 [Undibacterium sp. Jales W-56]|uniref:hypothetical protein n=1 Tax=Undibacterium sp. Jales W-56 TaxID=2897325 RepID=UPI0021D19F55|nr:hypothetical protein [Undibacterium sp. Jales W-56]MCU6433349.1 hypothetical protein [Undibacterium sp. Jales W-56]